MYSSHRDACILSKYASDISSMLDAHYVESGLNDHIIAYRKLGRANYDFSAAAYRFAQSNRICVALCFDITGFFSNIDHAILKNRLKRLLGVDEIPMDWYVVFRHVTKYSNVDRVALEAHPVFSRRMKEDPRKPIATIMEIRAAGIPIDNIPTSSAYRKARQSVVLFRIFS